MGGGGKKELMVEVRKQGRLGEWGRDDKEKWRTWNIS